ncbi:MULTISPECIES: peptide-methionine (S)-S-oxide reductase MsrA [unclassified Bordetella]|uniref:peptide-methionine (S)-S-oxide reductase MsrA n=1 Tax=unclassified Bordetella TaxID=2630031 RepID=UPI001329A253|nr:MULTISPECIES: peptide-methionine (S)-S-oxide reductase MsrA [unclassified Bordetella]MVW73611.1 peptide-methionine (S)-S-oxide reductase MsrA [Bordetella sp. 15P40C-2]MVW79152.1 peptide-methionine (S)-S-oxide reductase MsrA [Bordetella sp. 02P26C-1]
MAESQSQPQTQVAILGGGCFWCVEAVLTDLRGVLAVEPGYSGGHVANPSYEQVCGKDTGHVEVARVEFDPATLSYADLLRVFFATHDPTTPGRQGNDVGPQYESTIFWVDQAQRETAQAIIAELEEQQLYPEPIITQLRPLEKFWPAEDYHRNYFALHPEQGYCQFVIAPKVAKFRKQYSDRLKK